MKVFAQISVGELFDKLTILTIKTEKITDKNKLKNIQLELNILNEETKKIPSEDPILNNNIEMLKNINLELWDIENIKRELEHKQDFGSEFIRVSRDVHFKNDQRAIIKKEINDLTGSIVSEEKEYSKY